MNLPQISSAGQLTGTELLGVRGSKTNNENLNNDSPNLDFPIPPTVRVKTLTNEDPKELKRRILLEAASEAGLDGTKQQAEFVEKYVNRDISFEKEEDDRSKNDDRTIKRHDLTGGTINYKLSPDKEQVDLRRLQNERLAEGGKLVSGKTYEKSAKGESFTKSTFGRTPQTVAAYEKQQARKYQELYEQARLINATFGTPSKLNEIKQAWVAVGEGVSADDKDAVLSAYINKNYGNGNLWGTHKQDILEIAKTNGVKIENVSVEKGVAKFDISVESLLKLHISYLGVQEKVNTVDALTAKLKEDAAFNQFLKGVGEGAWGTLKENWKMVTHPVQTIQDVGEAIKTIANLSADDVQKIYENLKGEAYEFATETELKDASRQVGKVVGGLLIEAALGKGVVKFAKGGLELAKAIKGTKLATEIALKSKQIGSFIGKTPIPVPGVKVLELPNVGKIAVPDVELTKLADIIKPMESRAKEIFSKGRRNLDIQEVSGGHTIERHVGKSESWLRKRLENDADLKYASSFRNETIANRVQGRFVKHFKDEVEEWFKKNSIPFKKDFDMLEAVGNIVQRGKSGEVLTTKVRVIVVKDTSSSQGWRIHTSFPIIKEGVK